ncbi:MAG: adenosylmethionine decarboxylase [Candidatus Bathyarchaeia archaeon]
MRGVKLTLGRHIVAEMYGCDKDYLSNPQLMEELLLEAARRAELTIVTSKTHNFIPGVTSLVIVGESHLAIHTWPEYGYAAVDVFVCGSKDPWRAYDVIYERLKPERVKATELKRGVITMPGASLALDGRIAVRKTVVQTETPLDGL